VHHFLFHPLIFTDLVNHFRKVNRLFDPCRDSKTWSTGGIEGVHRFLGRTWRLVVGAPLPDGSYKDGTMATDDKPTFEQLRVLHKCIARVGHSCHQVE
jgi:leucyl-tRNA synthetase